MADYALVLDALDHQLPPPAGASNFYKFYTADLPRFTAEEVIEGSEFATDLLSWFNQRHRSKWTGTATELLKEVAVKRFDTSSGGAPKIPKTADYPRTPRAVTAALKCLAPVLRTLNIVWTPPKPGSSHKARVHTIAATCDAENADSHSSTGSPSQEPETASETASTAPTAPPQQLRRISPRGGSPRLGAIRHHSPPPPRRHPRAGTRTTATTHQKRR